VIEAHHRPQVGLEQIQRERIADHRHKPEGSQQVQVANRMSRRVNTRGKGAASAKHDKGGHQARTIRTSSAPRPAAVPSAPTMTIATFDLWLERSRFNRLRQDPRRLRILIEGTSVNRKCSCDRRA
jgi:hypothetical protein